MNYELNSNDEITKLIHTINVFYWIDLQEYVKSIPYGRISNKEDVNLVIQENNGTCSSKHILLKRVAELNHIPNVKLIIGIYKMTKNNTPKIGNELSKNNLDYIPEAHCYLKINNTVVDCTNIDSDFKKIEKDILKEIEVSPQEAIKFKTHYHQNYIKEWLQNHNINFSFNDIWRIREQCIQNLSQ